MELVPVIVLFAIGIVFIVKGGDYFVDAASWIAEVSGIPKLIVGATIVSVATTLPEMLVSTMAAVQGKVDMSVGNAVGSVTANLGLILAIALICMPSAIRRRDYLVKSLLMLAAAGFVVAAGFTGNVSTVYCLCLFAILAAFLYENVSGAKAAMKSDEPAEGRPALTKKTAAVNLIKFVVGAVGIVWGADLLVDNGSALARYVGISERVIGVTIIAIGTSLPELITTITAIVKKQSALSAGNILGANIMDLTLIMPLSSIVSGKSLPISQSSAMLDLPACLIVGLIAVVPTLVSAKFSRWQGVVLLLVYGAYVYMTCTL